MELRQLRYFVAVAEERHFGRAAEQLHIAQPGLSQQIMALEKSIGARLFDRDVRPVALTEAGEALLPRARAVIEAADQALEAAREPAPSATGVLRLGTPILGHFPALRDLEELFRSRFPEAELRMSPGLSLQNLDLLSRGELDAAILHPPFESPRIPEYLRLGAHELMIMLPVDHPLASLERLSRAQLLEERFLDWPDSINPKVLDHMRNEVFGGVQHPNRVQVADSIDGPSRATLVAEGMGIAIDAAALPLESLPERQGVVYKRVEDPAPLLEHGLVWFEDGLSPLASALVDVAKELVGRDEWSPPGAPSAAA